MSQAVGRKVSREMDFQYAKSSGVYRGYVVIGTSKILSRLVRLAVRVYALHMSRVASMVLSVPVLQRAWISRSEHTVLHKADCLCLHSACPLLIQCKCSDLLPILLMASFRHTCFNASTAVLYAGAVSNWNVCRFVFLLFLVQVCSSFASIYCMLPLSKCCQTSHVYFTIAARPHAELGAYGLLFGTYVFFFLLQCYLRGRPDRPRWFSRARGSAVGVLLSAPEHHIGAP